MKKVCQCLGIIEHIFLEEYKYIKRQFSEEICQFLLRNCFIMGKIMSNFYVARTFEQYFAGKTELIRSAMTS